MAGTLGSLRGRLTDRARSLHESAAPVIERLEPVAARVVGPIRRVIEPITRLGWLVAGIGVVAWWVGVRLGWDELMILAALCLILVVVAVLSTLGRLGLELDTAVLPDRVVVGNEAVGQVTAVNPGPRVTFGSRIEVPVGSNIHSFEVGSLKSGEEHLEPFIVPTDRRAVIPIGPAASVKGDPLGMARREVASGQDTVPVRPPLHGPTAVVLSRLVARSGRPDHQRPVHQRRRFPHAARVRAR